MREAPGNKIAELRKAQGMTRLELAEKMAVTENVILEWENNLSYPDNKSLQILAELLDVSSDELLQPQKPASVPTKDFREIIPLIFKAVALAMGIAVIVLTSMNKLEVESGIVMLGIGLACAGVSLLGR